MFFNPINDVSFALGRLRLIGSVVLVDAEVHPVGRDALDQRVDLGHVVAAGHLVDRSALMWNRFIVVGPATDPARLSGLGDPAEAFKRIRAAGTPVTRAASTYCTPFSVSTCPRTNRAYCTQPVTASVMIRFLIPAPNTAMIVTGALVGSSGAMASCRGSPPASATCAASE